MWLAFSKIIHTFKLAYILVMFFFRNINRMYKISKINKIRRLKIYKKGKIFRKKRKIRIKLSFFYFLRKKYRKIYKKKNLKFNKKIVFNKNKFLLNKIKLKKKKYNQIFWK